MEKKRKKNRVIDREKEKLEERLSYRKKSSKISFNKF
jgi:hypothetical protein